MPPAAVSTTEERIQEEAARWFARLRGDDVSAAQRAAFAAWRDADARHRHEYAVLEQLWDSSARLRLREPPRRRALRTATRLAGVVMLCLWLGWAWLDGRMATDPGERQHVRLADGSELDIAPDTRLRVKFDSSRRRIELDAGRIVVAVASDPRPFEVAAGGGLVRDIGTRFAVDAGAAQTHVTVVEGMVEIDLPASGRPPRKVGAGETAAYSDTYASPAQPVDAAAALAWTNGQLVFDAAPLTEVAAMLNRYRKTPIVLTDASLKNIRISGVFLIGDEASALRALEKVAPVVFADEGVRIVGRYPSSTPPSYPAPH